MNIMTLRYLKYHKKRSVLTILCILISVIMMSCVGIAFSSGKKYYQTYIEKTEGDYHYSIDSHDQSAMNVIKNNSQIQEYYLSSRKELSYQNSSLLMKTGDLLYFQKKNMNDYLIDGRLPVNINEIVITPTYLKAHQINKHIGDTIQFDNQKTYTIVGLMNPYTSYDFYNEVYQALSYIDIDDPYIIYIKNNNLSDGIKDDLQQLKQQIPSHDTIIPHSNYLAIQDILINQDSQLIFHVYYIIYVIIAVIMIISIIIIYQTFQLSTGERIQYLGILSSVGATSKQKKWSVYFEGFVLSLIAIPLGILLSFIGIYIALFFINQKLNILIHIYITPLYFTFIIICSLLTIFIALSIPARRISKISVMDALKNADEVKVKKEKLELTLLLKNNSSISTQLAFKNYKRQGRKSKTILISLIASMIAFISIYSFGKTIFFVLKDTIYTRDYEVEVDVQTHEELEVLQDILNTDPTVQSYILTSSTDIQATVDESYFHDIAWKDMPMKINGIDTTHFKKLCKDNHIDYSQDLALVYNHFYDNHQEYTRFKKMDKNFIKDMYEIVQNVDVNFEDSEEYKPLPLFSRIEMLNFDDVYDIDSQHYLVLIVDEEYYKENISKEYFFGQIQTTHHEELTNKLLSTHIQAIDQEAKDINRLNLIQMIELFTYSFVIIMIIFSFLNILNIMSVSVEKRKKEMAMLMSVGMSIRHIKTMLWKESMIYGLKAFCYSLPFCIVIEYILYGMSFSKEPFMPSWIIYFIALTGIMIVMMVAFQIGLNRLKKQNIIETLKDDM